MDLTVYTCQASRPRSCGFFLWEEDAKPREAAAVLSNCRSEPEYTAQTPTKSPGIRHRSKSPRDRSRTATPDPVPPQIASRASCSNAQTSWSVTADEGKDSFEWPSSDEDALFKAADRAVTVTMLPPETPRKVVRTDIFSSPGKRRYEEMETAAAAWPTPATDDIFQTPATGMRGKDLFSTASAAGLLSPAETPTPIRFRDAGAGGSADDPELVRDVIDKLRQNSVHMGPTAMKAVKSVLNTHVLKAQGIAKGRDISRLAIKSKDARIAELQARVAALEAECEQHKAVIRWRDMEVGRKR